MEFIAYLEKLSSKAPVPGGGGASAIGGAIGNGLGQMVANLTIGKKKYAQWEPEIIRLLDRMGELQARFMELAEEDERVFAPLAAAYRLPSGTEEEKAYKEQVMEGCLHGASLVPLEVMATGMEMLEILEVLEQKGSVMAVSDVGVAVQFIRAAITGAAMNVFINTKSMADRERAEELNRRAEELIRKGTETADGIYSRVMERLKER